jgi:hypothetical protein
MARQTIDWVKIAPIVIPTGAASANAQLIAVPTAAGVSFDVANRGFYWYMVVSGSPCYINWGTTNSVTASSSNVLHPIGRDDVPKSYPMLPGSVPAAGQGYWVAALALSGGTGQLSFIYGGTVGV